MTPEVGQLLTGAALRLRDSGIDTPRLEARLLLAQAMHARPDDLLREPGARVPADALACFETLLNRRAGHAPLAYLLGHREFWSLDFAVSPATLIPRPDSETLIEAARAAFAHRAPPQRILDLGTGTGCLLLAALAEFPGAFGVGVDLVAAAAALAARNAAALGLGARAAFLCGNWADALHARFDLVLCNPPYIPTSELERLMPEVAWHEPASALDGGPDGLSAYRCVLPVLRRNLRARGVAVVEVGAGQAQAVAELARRAGIGVAERADLAGIPRAMVLTADLP